MDSILKPLANKVAIYTAHIGIITRGLIAGDPIATSQVQNLWKELSNFYQECQSGYAQVYSSYNNSVSTAQAAYNPTPMIKMIAYYIGEVMAAIQLIANLMKLIASVLSIATILEVLVSELVKLQQSLNMPALWMRKAVDRAKQRLNKNIEWQKRTISANFNVIYLNGQVESYQVISDQLTASLPKPPAPNKGINGTDINGTFVYYDKGLSTVLSNNPSSLAISSTSSPVNSTVNNIVNSPTASSSVDATIAAANSSISSTTDTNTINDQITSVKEKLVGLNNELKIAQSEPDNIKRDKKFWNDLWDKQAAQDKKDLLDNVATIGINV
jgi:hypothetical protein